MELEHKDAIREANRTRHIKCGKCGSTGTTQLDGSKIGGFPGLQYLYCGGCGWSRACTQKPKREKLR